MVQEKQKRTKVIAMYLPQFHEIPENNEWWGKGFTEWTNVKKSEPLYKGHMQPREPHNDDYYDLADENVMQRQMQMAREYGVDGFCFYHYWFNGKKLLEKPLEQLLETKNVILPYCFCWANEPWTRTWDGNKGSEQVLMPQEYGEEEEWEAHFEYLERFFNQERYIKIQGKPVILIYKAVEIEKRKEMIEKWNELALKKGYPGIFVIMVHRLRVAEEQNNYADGIMDFEPFATLRAMETSTFELPIKKYFGVRKGNKNQYYNVIDYAAFCEHLTGRYCAKNRNHYLGFFAGWDNTPRRGIETKTIFENNTPEVFEKYFRIQYKKSLSLNNEFMFINAWNEWGEGTFLEPDKVYGFGYLEAIQRVKTEFINA